jgi:hypothetical protein
MKIILYNKMNHAKSKLSPRRSTQRSSKRSPRRSTRRSSKRSPRRSTRRSSKRSPRRSRSIKDVLDRKKLLSETPSDIKKKLSVTLKKNKYAGTGLFATKPIKKGNVIAYYKMKVHQDTTKHPYRSPTKCMYCFTVYTKGDRMSSSLMGDIDKESAPLPKNNIPYWAYFSNEPSLKQKENAYIDIALKENYKDRKRLKPGDFMTYKLRASKNIKPGEEVVWCYGSAYARNYETSCS